MDEHLLNVNVLLNLVTVALLLPVTYITRRLDSRVRNGETTEGEGGADRRRPYVPTPPGGGQDHFSDLFLVAPDCAILVLDRIDRSTEVFQVQIKGGMPVMESTDWKERGDEDSIEPTLWA